MTNVVKGDQVKDSYGKIYDVIEVHEHNVMVLEPGKPYWERICMGRFDFDSYFRRADEPMTDDMLHFNRKPFASSFLFGMTLW